MNFILLVFGCIILAAILLSLLFDTEELIYKKRELPTNASLYPNMFDVVTFCEYNVVCFTKQRSISCVTEKEIVSKACGGGLHNES